jgi:hypothetical protein
MTAEAEADPGGKTARRVRGLAHSLIFLSTFIALVLSFAFLCYGFFNSFLIVAVSAIFPTVRFIDTLIHELGHAICGLIAGWRPVVIAAWPCAWHVPTNTLVVSVYVSTDDGGGYVYSVPRRPEFNTRLRRAILVAGGPLFSLIAGIVFLAMAFLPFRDWLSNMLPFGDWLSSLWGWVPWSEAGQAAAPPDLSQYPSGMAPITIGEYQPPSQLPRQLACIAAALGVLSLNAFFITIIPMTYHDEGTSDGRKLLGAMTGADAPERTMSRHVAGMLHYNVRLRDIPQWMYDAARADAQTEPAMHDGWELARAFDERQADPVRCRQLLEAYRATYGEDDWVASLDAYLAAIYEADADRAEASLAARPVKGAQPAMWRASEAAIAARRGDQKLMQRKLDEMESALLAKDPFPDRTFDDIRRQIVAVGKATAAA